MRTVPLGNAGAGKSTLARKLIAQQPAARLSLDEVAFAGGTARRPLADSIAAVQRFIAANKHWIIDGCYADIIEAILPQCDELIFLNPGVEACVTHCHARPWEPEKWATRAEQDAHLQDLVAWVRNYESRADEYGLARHRALFDAFQGRKREFTDPDQYAPA